MANFQFEDFSTKVVSNDPTVAPSTSLEEHTLESFEQGYKAGWDDAVEAQKDDQKRISADFSRHLQELSFTLTEARTQVIQSITPLLQEMVHKVLPKVSMAGLSQAILDQVVEIAKTHANTPIEIIVAPTNETALQHLIGDNSTLDVTVISEPSFAQGLASIRFAESEVKIDLDSVIQNFEVALSQFLTKNKEAV